MGWTPNADGKEYSFDFRTTYLSRNANGKTNLRIMFSQSQHYVDNSVNIKRGQRQ